MVSVGKYTSPMDPMGYGMVKLTARLHLKIGPNCPKRKRERCHPVPPIFQVANLLASFQGRFFPVNTWKRLRVLETLGLFVLFGGDV